MMIPVSGYRPHNYTLMLPIISIFQDLFQIANSQNTLPPPTETFQAMDFSPNIFQNTLTAFPSTKEIRTTLWSLHPQKAFSPDRLHV